MAKSIEDKKLNRKEDPNKILSELEIKLKKTEAKLEKTQQKFNESKAEIVKMKDEINIARKERTTFDSVFKQLEMEIKNKENEFKTLLFNNMRIEREKKAAEDNLKELNINWKTDQKKFIEECEKAMKKDELPSIISMNEEAKHINFDESLHVFFQKKYWKFFSRRKLKQFMKTY